MILDCPICNEKRTVLTLSRRTEAGERYYATCAECHLRTKDFASMKQLMNYWFQRDPNYRYIEPEQKKFPEVVRCKYCKWFENVSTVQGISYGECNLNHIGGVYENWYCADGTRRDNDVVND